MNKVRLGDICRITMGQSPDSSTYNDDGIGVPFYQGNADFGKLHPTAVHWCTEPKKTAEKGDILISVRAPIGALNIANEHCCIGRGLASITVNEDVAERDYIWYLLKSKDSYLQSKGTGSTFKAINKNVLFELPVDLPSKHEQKRISDLISKSFELATRYNNQLIKLDELIKSRFVEMFGNPEINSLGWDTIALSELCDLQNGYAFKSDDYTDYSSVLNCRMSNIRPNGGFDADYHPKYLPEEYWKKYKGYRLYDGDVIIAMTDMASDPKILGVPTIVMCNDHKMLLNQRVGKLIFKEEEKINRVFLMHYLGLEFIRKKLAKRAGGSTQINVGKPAILATEVIVPSYKLQKRFADFVTQVEKQKTTVQQSIDKLKTLKKSLMQEYFG